MAKMRPATALQPMLHWCSFLRLRPRQTSLRIKGRGLTLMPTLTIMHAARRWMGLARTVLVHSNPIPIPHTLELRWQHIDTTWREARPFPDRSPFDSVLHCHCAVSLSSLFSILTPHAYGIWCLASPRRNPSRNPFPSLEASLGKVK